MQELFYPEGQSSVGSASQELIVTPWSISKADILKECSLGFNLSCKSYQSYFGSHLKHIKLFLNITSGNLLEKITRVNITKNNYKK